MKMTDHLQGSLFLFLLLQSQVFLLGHCKVLMATYSTEQSCRLQEKIDSGCAQLKMKAVRSLIECAIFCRLGCAGFSMSDDQMCYLHKPCSVSMDSATCHEKDRYKFYPKINRCEHNSTWDIDTDACRCANGWVGLRCERLPTNCHELVIFGYQVPQKLEVDIKPLHYPSSFKVKCNLQSDFATTYLMLNIGRIASNTTWTEFVKGFVTDKSNYWLGLEKIKALNKGSGLNVLSLDVQFGYNTSYNLFSYRYNDFQMSNEDNNFSFTFANSSHSGVGYEYKRLNSSYESCLDSLQNTQFSTWNNDKDEARNKNCAAVSGTGWWFKDCTMKCNPMGSSRNQWLAVNGLNLITATYAESIMYFIYEF